MLLWWQELDQLRQILFAVGVISAGVFVILTILTLIGLDFDGALETDPTSGGESGFSEYFSLRNALVFFTGMSWITLAFLELPGIPSVMALAAGCVAGVGLVIANLYIFAMVATLHVEGNLNMNDAIGCRGQVILSIPANMDGIGKVSVQVNDRSIEFLARTAETTGIARNETIDVVELLAGDIVRVKRANPNS